MHRDETVLVTGGAGYIGTACVAALCDRGYQVVVIDNLSKGQRDKVHPHAIFIEGDISDKNIIDKIFNEYKFTNVIHLAAGKSVEESEANPEKYFGANVVGTLNLLSVMADHGVGNLVFSSTAAVYAPGGSTEHFNEEASTEPINVYGRSKLMAEMAIKDYVRTGKLSRFAILRYFNVAGDAGLNYKERESKNVFPILANAINTGSTFHIFGTDYATNDGTCVRDYIHLIDLVDAHLAVLNHDSSGVFNLGTSKGQSVRQLITEFEKVSGKQLLIEERPRRAGDPAILLADATKAKSELGWEPSHSLSDMVESTLRCYT